MTEVDAALVGDRTTAWATGEGRSRRAPPATTRGAPAAAAGPHDRRGGWETKRQRGHWCHFDYSNIVTEENLSFP